MHFSPKSPRVAARIIKRSLSVTLIRRTRTPLGLWARTGHSGTMVFAASGFADGAILVAKHGPRIGGADSSAHVFHAPTGTTELPAQNMMGTSKAVGAAGEPFSACSWRIGKAETVQRHCRIELDRLWGPRS